MVSHTSISDSNNPYFQCDINKICAVCLNQVSFTAIELKTLVRNAHNDIKVYQMLEAISEFKLHEDGPQFICEDCFQSAVYSCEFQKRCNTSYSYFVQFTQQQSLLAVRVNTDVKLEIPDDINEDIDTFVSVSSDCSEYQDEAEESNINKNVLQKREKCKICDKTLKAKSMKIHMRTHNDEELFKCTYCEAGFKYQVSLKRHINSHENKRDYKCGECGKAFHTSTALKDHEYVHTGERQHPCHDCEMEFKTKSALLQHRLTHLSKKPFSCELCEYSCIRRAGLKVHMKTHTGERPHFCSICNKRFTRTEHLKKHMKTHTKHTKPMASQHSDEIQEIPIKMEIEDTETHITFT